MATEIRFYHLLRKSVAAALPEILTRAIADGRRVVVKTPDAATAEELAEHLWTYNEPSFLPHGTRKDGHPADQPIWLTDGDDNPNGAAVLVLTGGTAAADPGAWALCCAMLDGNDEAQVAAAREQWKAARDAGFTVTYWKQNESGGWDRK
jgi:DNA polymerase-3 subunit chi